MAKKQMKARKATAKKAAARKAPATRSAKAPADDSTHRRDLFVAEYLVDLNGAKAAIRAGYSPDSARQRAYELLQMPEIEAKIQAAMDARAARVGITADRVLTRIGNIAFADPSELIELRRTCCRYCWGKNNQYQFTPRELAQARRDYERALADAEKEGNKLAPFSELGGIGWDPRKDPSPTCPECFGEGVQDVYVRDTRDVSQAARQLYAGVKQTQHGLEIKLHSQTKMLELAGKHLGLFREKVELTGKNGGPVVHQTLGSLLEEIDGAGTGLPDGRRRN
jgi:hypothetical protein